MEGREAKQGKEGWNHVGRRGGGKKGEKINQMYNEASIYIRCWLMDSSCVTT